MVGTSGRIGLRVLPVTASARSVPPLICAAADATVLNPIGLCPPTIADTDGPAPLYGTCTRSRPSDCRICSPARCACVPAPGDAKLNLPGLALTSSTSSLTVLAGIDGLTESTVVDDTASVTGA